jgi:PLP dependent protein
MAISQNLDIIKRHLPAHVRLVAVSKNRSNDEILQAYDAGQRLFGENKAQQLSAKYPTLPADIKWHFIGHLQTNKIKYIAPFVSLIHSIDSLKLLEEVNREAYKQQRVIACLLQFHIAREETKFGLSPEEAAILLGSETFSAMKNIRIHGVMGMASFIDDMEAVRKEFKYLRSVFEELKKTYFAQHDDFCEISMGMTQDYHVAIEEGSTLLRIGTAIFESNKLM